MKFVLTREHHYPWPVTVTLPDPAQPGNVIEQKFNMTFRALPLDEAEALDAEIAALPTEQAAARQHDLLLKVAQGWDDQVVDDEGKAVPFSGETLQLAMQHSWFRIGVYSAYRRSLQGRAAEQGN
ncbi:MAG TPA: hypothetical protein VGN60_09155 [Devosia sp.]|jgi:hypothetical protein|nr:hypothetical protein [Devosia sp.]